MHTVVGQRAEVLGAHAASWSPPLSLAPPRPATTRLGSRAPRWLPPTRPRHRRPTRSTHCWTVRQWGGGWERMVCARAPPPGSAPQTRSRGLRPRPAAAAALARRGEERRPTGARAGVRAHSRHLRQRARDDGPRALVLLVCSRASGRAAAPPAAAPTTTLDSCKAPTFDPLARGARKAGGATAAAQGATQPPRRARAPPSAAAASEDEVAEGLSQLLEQLGRGERGALPWLTRAAWPRPAACSVKHHRRWRALPPPTPLPFVAAQPTCRAVATALQPSSRQS